MRISDGERVNRRQEEEIVGERRDDAGEERRPQAKANGDSDDGGEEDEVAVGWADRGPDQLGDGKRYGDRSQCGAVGARIKAIRALGGARRLLRNWLAGNGIAGDDMDADIAGTTHEIVHHRAMHDFEPAGACRFADDDLRDVVGLRIADNVLGDAMVVGWQGEGLAAKRFGEPQRIGDAVAFFLRELQAAPALDIERDPRAMQPVGESLGVAHQAGRAQILADAHQNAFARRPRSLDRMRLHFREQLLVNPLGGAAQGQFAQRGEVGGREEMFERALGLFRNVDLALLEALDQIVGRQIDQFDGVGAVEHGIRHGLAHAHMSDLRDHVVEALDVLDIDGSIDVDAGTHQLFDVEIALGMAAAFDVGMCKLVDQHDLRPPRDDGVEVHLGQRLSFIFDAPARNDFKSL